ncbi:MAG TPA: lytic polysaccharide monooxygenase [Vicinamibacterales bacterium]
MTSKAIKAIKALSVGFVMLLLGTSAFAHGYVQDPPARNWYCGFITKPDHVSNGVAQFPVCGDAFFAPGVDPNAGYNFMSVLSHSRGHAGPAFPSPTFPPNTINTPHVCSFSSQTWNNNNPALNTPTPWDQPINWPTTTITAGTRIFTWNVSNGPHFDDTEDFTYWITRSTYQHQVGRALTWADLEPAPFCDEDAVHSRSGGAIIDTGNPDIILNRASQTMGTRCTVPSRAAGSRHVIYAEWGRLGANSTPWQGGTDERFHGCIDVVFQGGGGTTVTPVISANQPPTAVTGAANVPLNGSTSTCSTGCTLSYSWTLNSTNPVLYTISNPTAAQTMLNMANPAAGGTVTVTLTVTGGGVSASASRTITHSPTGGSIWRDLGALTLEPRTIAAGNNVSVRTVTNNGGDAFWPTQPLVITSANGGPTAWPLALGQAINAQNGVVRVGVLNTSDQVVPQANATSNRVFTSAANIVSAFLQVQPPGVPAAPTNLNATPGNNQNSLTWTASAGATSYNVKRSTTNGGPYTNVLVGVTGTAVTDIGLNNGTTYFYVVTAVNASGESAFSSQDDATPSAPTGGVVTGTTSMGGSAPWYFENKLSVNNTAAITNVVVTIRVARTTGITFNGSYETVGGFTRTNSPSASPIVFTYTRAASLPAGTNRLFVAQTNGTGTPHPSTGDTWTITYNIGAQSFTVNGTF